MAKSKSKSVMALLRLVERSWLYAKRSKDSSLHHLVAKDDGCTVISVCPEKIEVVGGKYDGKNPISKFVFDAGTFLTRASRKGFEVEKMALLSRASNKHQDSMIMYLSRKKKNYRLQILTRPAREITETRKLRAKENS